MRKFSFSFLAATIALWNSCSDTGKTENAIDSGGDPIVHSFAFIGCNRLSQEDLCNDSATNNGLDSSSANYHAIQKIFNDINSMQHKPAMLFFLGDLVSGQATTDTLANQLRNWLKLYNAHPISRSGIELVAVPGNHEMLYFNGATINGHYEWPLKGTTEVWLKYMRSYMPADRDTVSTDSANYNFLNSMTFSFVRNHTAFIVMNTDTYNNYPVSDKYNKSTIYGIEGVIPEKWIEDQVGKYHNDTTIKRIFVLGHKPCYVGDTINTGHEGLLEARELWPVLQQNKVCAMLSAHNHSYQRMQPGGEGTYQVIAGNGGSHGPTPFFGYSIINIYNSGKIQLISKGYDVDDKKTTYFLYSPNPFTTKDSTLLTWTPNANPYQPASKKITAAKIN